jgi:hypothetical protein
MTDPKCQHGSSEAGWMEQNETPRTDAWYSKYGPLKRGEKHPSLDKVFWGYQKGVPTWVTIERRNELLKRNA